MLGLFASAPRVLSGVSLGGSPMPIIETAREADAQEIAAVLVASIRELCAADHHGDPQVIARWTANKTPEEVRGWIASERLDLLVAREGNHIACVGACGGGEIRLNYVAPAHRFAGHSVAMLAALEGRLAERGVATGRLVTTQTAHRFYLARGWRDDGEATFAGGLVRQAMVKDLAR